jgi:hypothetical protein
MGDPTNLRNFVTWATGNYPAEKTALIIFGHGGGLSGICYDYSSEHSQLTLDEVQQAMSGFHVDLLATEPCGMGMLEIAYEWSNFTDYYLADQMPMKIEALDFESVIFELCENPIMPAWELGELFCIAYSDSNPYLATEMYALINCSRLPRLMSKLDSLSTNLSSFSTEYLEHLSVIREDMYYDNYHRRLDIQSMIDVIRDGFPFNTSLLIALDELEYAYEDTVIYSIHGKYATDASGLGIFFPRDKERILGWGEYLGLETDTILEGMDFMDNSLWDEFLLAYLEVADNLTYIPWVYQEISLDAPYQVDCVRGTLNVYGCYVAQPGIYNFTLSSIINDLGFSVENADFSAAVTSDFVWSSLVNPEQGSIEHVSYWLNPGQIWILVDSETETSNGTLYVTKSDPKPLQLNQKISGQFPYALGYCPPPTIYNYYEIDLTPGTYELKIDIDWPVGLEVFIIDKPYSYILTEFFHIPGKDFEYNLTVLTQNTFVIGFGSYTGTGEFTFELIMDITSSTDLKFSFVFIVLPIASAIVIVLSKRKKLKIRNIRN